MAISNALVNIQQVMKNREEEKVPDARSEENGRIHAIVPKDVEDIVDYIYTTIDNCLSNTFPNLRRPLKEGVLSEIGDTPQGQFAINAVKGRAAARPRYQNKQYGGMQAKAQQDAIVNQAGDAAYYARKEADPQYQNRDMDDYANAGYNYGFQKGMTN